MKKKQPEYKGKLTVRKGDDVVVLTGKNRGAHGKVLRVVPAKGRVVVEGVNLIKRATRPNPQKNIKGGIVLPRRVTRIIVFLAISIPFLMAVGTSFAFPAP